MDDGVHASVAAIEKMEEACARFSRTVLDRLPDVEAKLRQVTEALEDRSDELRREISHLADEISSADEDEDTSYASSRLAEAEEELASIRRRRSKLAEASAAYTVHARNAQHLSTDHTIKGREYLRGVADDLKAYFAKGIDGVRHGVKVVAPEALVKTPCDLSTAEKQALRKYTGDESEEINTALRNGLPNYVALRRAELISQALSKLPPFHGIVYQGASRADEQLTEYEPGNVVSRKEFTSSSPSLEVAEGFVDSVLFTITSKTGRPIADFSEFFHEQEVLFDKDTRFRVLGREIINDVRHIRLEEL